VKNDPKEFTALVSLLDDPDNTVFDNISDRLISFGSDVIPALEGHWEGSLDSMIQERIENIIHRIQFDQCHVRLHHWVQEGGISLLDGALIIASYQYPDLDEDVIRQQIARIRADIWIELNENLTALEKVRIFNHILYDIHGFSGNTRNYQSPENSYINSVLETKKGNPLSLGLIYCVLAKDLGIPIQGVNMPEHFILAYIDENGILSNGENVIFYINAFNHGSIFNRPEVFRFLEKLGKDPENEDLEPCSNITFINRLTNNLLHSYSKAGLNDKVDEIRELQQAFMTV
jgi:regulator of sirC expression with transglutaminase-like and TPR domain